MRVKFALLLSASLLTGAIAATAQPLPCVSVAPEVRERVREAGACRDTTSGDVALKGATLNSSSTVTMTLSDGTVVRIPRDISSSIYDGRKRAPTHEIAPPKSALPAGESPQSKADASGGQVRASQKLKVPDVIGRSFGDADSVLAQFKVDRIEVASAAPAGEVLAQQPAPATFLLRGSTVSVQVSDGSLAGAADTTSVTASGTAAESPPAPAAAADSPPTSAVALGPVSEPTVPPETRARFFPTAFPESTALVLGAGVLLGLLLGALLMRQWLLRRKLAADENTAPLPRLYQQHHQPVKPAAGVSKTVVAREIVFAARLDPGETTVEFALLRDHDEVEFELSSDQHA